MGVFLHPFFDAAVFRFFFILWESTRCHYVDILWASSSESGRWCTAVERFQKKMGVIDVKKKSSLLKLSRSTIFLWRENFTKENHRNSAAETMDFFCSSFPPGKTKTPTVNWPSKRVQRVQNRSYKMYRNPVDFQGSTPLENPKNTSGATNQPTNQPLQRPHPKQSGPPAMGVGGTRETKEPRKNDFQPVWGPGDFPLATLVV